ncbi:tyrosine-type recombinase/integrase [Micromonospora tulbaghiae]|uniref:tyrosine-type recombinase/integrase n=1 Tax=Micromonospora tulbaghiae TaxID=479978 RepID=UPI003F53F528
MSIALSGEVLPAVPAPHRGALTVGGAAGDGLEELLREWLVSYASPHTRDAYQRDLRHWLTFLAVSGVDPLTEARRVHTHAWLRAQEATGRASAATRARRLAAVSAFYSWLIAEDRTDRANPAAINPKQKPKTDPTRPSTAGLSRAQAEALLAAADADTGPQAARTAAIVALLLYTGLRVGELVGADVEQLGHYRNHRVLHFTAKGGGPHLVALPAPVTRRLDAYLAGRADLTEARVPVPAGQAASAAGGHGQRSPRRPGRGVAAAAPPRHHREDPGEDEPSRAAPHLRHPRPRRRRPPRRRPGATRPRRRPHHPPLRPRRSAPGPGAGLHPRRVPHRCWRRAFRGIPRGRGMTHHPRPAPG